MLRKRRKLKEKQFKILIQIINLNFQKEKMRRIWLRRKRKSIGVKRKEYI